MPGARSRARVIQARATARIDLRMTPLRKATLAVAGLRIAYGAALALAPARTTRAWLGSGGAVPGGSVAVRALGAREIVLHGGAVAAALGDGPVAPWLIGSIAGDMSDIVATFVAGD